jgi:glycine betaine/proline transport system permease protein
MIELPIGENFESLVGWLKESFKGAFDLTSNVLDFSIKVLENVLLLNSETVYASVLFGMLLALIVGLVAKRLGGAKYFLPTALIVACLFGASEFWRLNTLGQQVDTETAEAMAKDFTALQTGLQATEPSDFSDAESILQTLLQKLPESDDRSSAAYKARASTEDALRDIRRTRSQEYDDVYDGLNEALLAIRASRPSSLDASQIQALQGTRDRYYALTLIEESDQLLEDFREVSASEPFERRSEFINTRSYDELLDMLKVSQRYFAEGNSELANLIQTANTQIRLLNPERLSWYPLAATILLLALIAWLVVGRAMVVFTLVGFFLILTMQMWVATIESLALVISATVFALILGVPIGIAAARSTLIDRGTRPILDFMQTMPAFVYLIPAVIFFGLGKVPGAVATLIFAMPPAVRLTSLGIRQVPSEVVEAGQAFGATATQLLFKAQLPIAMPTILAGVNQTIMLALSMVVIGGMIGAGGLGEVVLGGITQMKLGLGFEGGIAVVILAIYLDRVTQALGTPKTKNQK